MREWLAECCVPCVSCCVVLSWMVAGWLRWLPQWWMRAADGGYSLLPQYERTSLPLRRPAAFAPPHFPHSHSHSLTSPSAHSSHSHHWPSDMSSPSARSAAGWLLAALACCGLVALLWLATVAPSSATAAWVWQPLRSLVFAHWTDSSAATTSTATATAAVTGAAAASHDDVSLSASFALSCASAEQCPFHSARRLIVVTGHAVLTSLDYHNLTDDSQWALQSFQRSQLPTFISHIRRGVELAAADPSAVLLFSGGETRPSAGPRSEALSYWMVAELSNWWQHNTDDRSIAQSDSSASPQVVQWSVRSRASTEEFARDSYENLLFSICRFHELTQRYPDAITVVGFSFKRDRFLQLHASAMLYPLSQLTYVGLDTSTQQNQSELRDSEIVNSYRPFSVDPYGCFPPLSTKRLQRNPFRRSHGYGHSSSCPALTYLLHHCGPARYTGPALPWQQID